nr:uncharacterized protein LOC129049867 [Pongo abelii]
MGQAPGPRRRREDWSRDLPARRGRGLPTASELASLAARRRRRGDLRGLGFGGTRAGPSVSPAGCHGIPTSPGKSPKTLPSQSPGLLRVLPQVLCEGAAPPVPNPGGEQRAGHRGCHHDLRDPGQHVVGPAFRLSSWDPRALKDPLLGPPPQPCPATSVIQEPSREGPQHSIIF